MNSAIKADSRLSWFPPPTFQLRLRSLTAITFTFDAKLEENCDIFVSLHTHLDEESFWRSDSKQIPRGEDRAEFQDLDFSQCSKRGLKGVILKVRNSASASSSLFTSVVTFNGLRCLGVQKDKAVKSKLLFQMKGNYFAVPRSGSGMTPKREEIPRFPPHQMVKSYDDNLLQRFLRMQRATLQQSNTNKDLRKELIRRGLDPQQQIDEHLKKKKLTLRQQVFSNPAKCPQTRLQEIELKSKLELIKLRINLANEEKSFRDRKLSETEAEIGLLKGEINERNSANEIRRREFEEQKEKMRNWKKRYAEKVQFSAFLAETAKSNQFRLLSKFREIFPIDAKENTVRFVQMPLRVNSRQEQQMSVALGWVAHLLKIFGSVLDVPLRYPVKRNSHIVDFAFGKDSPELNRREYPLTAVKSSNEAVEFAVFLLNKNLAQMRFDCGLNTTDIRSTLKNLDELMNLAALVDVRPIAPLASVLSPPPKQQTNFCDQDETGGNHDHDDVDDFSDEEIEIEIGEEPPTSPVKPATATSFAGDCNKPGNHHHQATSLVDVADRTKSLSIKTTFARKRIN